MRLVPGSEAVADEAVLADGAVTGEAPAPPDGVLGEQTRRWQQGLSALQSVRQLAPDRYARAKKEGRALGLPAMTLYRGAQQDGQQQADDSPVAGLMDLAARGNPYAQNALERFKRTATVLARGDLAAVAQDDLEALMRIEAASADAPWQALWPCRAALRRG